MKIYVLAEQHNEIKGHINALTEQKLLVEADIYNELNGENYKDDKIKVTITKSEAKTWDQEKLKEIHKEFPHCVRVKYEGDMNNLKSNPAVMQLALEALTTKENKPTFKCELV